MGKRARAVTPTERRALWSLILSLACLVVMAVAVVVFHGPLQVFLVMVGGCAGAVLAFSSGAYVTDHAHDVAARASQHHPVNNGEV